MPKKDKKHAKEKNIIIDPDTYRLMLQVYGKHSKIPYIYKVKVEEKEEKDVKT